MSRKRRPPWPLKTWPKPGETIAHAACREWSLLCGCPLCRVRAVLVLLVARRTGRQG